MSNAKFVVERFNLKKLRDAEGKGKISCQNLSLGRYKKEYKHLSHREPRSLGVKAA
jgi:hypothetical protein